MATSYVWNNWFFVISEIVSLCSSSNDFLPSFSYFSPLNSFRVNNFKLLKLRSYKIKIVADIFRENTVGQKKRFEVFFK